MEDYHIASRDTVTIIDRDFLQNIATEVPEIIDDQFRMQQVNRRWHFMNLIIVFMSISALIFLFIIIALFLPFISDFLSYQTPEDAISRLTYSSSSFASPVRAKRDISNNKLSKIDATQESSLLEAPNQKDDKSKFQYVINDNNEDNLLVSQGSNQEIQRKRNTACEKETKDLWKDVQKEFKGSNISDLNPLFPKLMNVLQICLEQNHAHTALPRHTVHKRMYSVDKGTLKQADRGYAPTGPEGPSEAIRTSQQLTVTLPRVVHQTCYLQQDGRYECTPPLPPPAKPLSPQLQPTALYQPVHVPTALSSPNPYYQPTYAGSPLLRPALRSPPNILVPPNSVLNFHCSNPAEYQTVSYPVVQGVSEYSQRSHARYNSNYPPSFRNELGNDGPCQAGDRVCGGACIPESSWCDRRVDCPNAEDETACTCAEYLRDKKCDGVFDCPDMADELACFECQENEFSCDNWDKMRREQPTCLPLDARCDGITQCPNGKDEHDCILLAPSIDNHQPYFISYSKGYLHKNHKGTWYPVCISRHDKHWPKLACAAEHGHPHIREPVVHFVPNNHHYSGSYLVLSKERELLVHRCQNKLSAYVHCPEPQCGGRHVEVETENRVTYSHSRYRPNPMPPMDHLSSYYLSLAEHFLRQNQRQGVYNQNRYARTPNLTDSQSKLPKTSAIGMESHNQAAFKDQKDTNRKRRKTVGRIVGGTDSAHGEWPWVVAIYQDGLFHCGGSIINPSYILSAAHCFHELVHFYYEVQAGTLRQLSFSPQMQTVPVLSVAVHHNYDSETMRNDIALLQLKGHLMFNRWVRPICLPEPDANFPVPGDLCTAVGWGALQEHGPDPDNMKKVEVPILSSCKSKSDKVPEVICAGYHEGGKDSCQGESGGPLLCRPSGSGDKWFASGIVSHGEGCARPEEPGVYTKVSSYINWINHTIKSKIGKRTNQVCPGLKCLHGRCISVKDVCDKEVHCLGAEDEINCSHVYDNTIHSRSAQKNNSVENSPKIFGHEVTSQKSNSAISSTPSSKQSVDINESSFTNNMENEEKPDNNAHKNIVEHNNNESSSSSYNKDGHSLESEESTIGVKDTQAKPSSTEATSQHFSTISISNNESSTIPVTRGSNTSSSSSEDGYLENEDSIDTNPNLRIQSLSTDATFLRNPTKDMNNLENNTKAPTDERYSTDTSSPSTHEDGYSSVKDVSTKTNSSLTAVVHSTEATSDHSPTIISSNSENSSRTATDNSNGYSSRTETSMGRTPSLRAEQSSTEPASHHYPTKSINNLGNGSTAEIHERNDTSPSSESSHNDDFPTEKVALTSKAPSQRVESDDAEDAPDRFTSISRFYDGPTTDSVNQKETSLEFSDSNYLEPSSEKPTQQSSTQAHASDGFNEFETTTQYITTTSLSDMGFSEMPPFFQAEIVEDVVTVFFYCHSLNQRIKIEYRCDDIVDCIDGSDEFNCSCKDYLSNSFEHIICDHKVDCRDKTDEIYCPAPCDEGFYYEQSNSSCLSLSIRCNGIKDLIGGEDEKNCYALTEDPEHPSFDLDGLPAFNMEGVVIFHEKDQWIPLCSDDPRIKDTTVIMMPQSIGQLTLEKTKMLYFKQFNCDLVWASLSPKPTANNKDTQWLTLISADGQPLGGGVLIEPSWIVTSVDLQNARSKNQYISASAGRHIGKGIGVYEQNRGVDLVVPVEKSEFTLLRLSSAFELSRGVMYLPHRDLPDLERNPALDLCFAVGYTNDFHVEIFQVNEEKPCPKQHACFSFNETHKKTQQNHWDGVVVCNSDGGTYVSCFFEKLTISGYPQSFKCISFMSYVDKALNIVDEESEATGSTETCHSIRCERGLCVPWSKVLDGVYDCIGGEDEQQFLIKEKLHHSSQPSRSCKKGEIECPGGNCQPASAFCDGVYDCSDHSDEPPECQNNCAEFLRLLYPEKLCDSFLNCHDKSDESWSTCGNAHACHNSSTFKCFRSEGCISQGMVCDGISDCSKGEDEENCLAVKRIPPKKNEGILLMNRMGRWSPYCYNNNLDARNVEMICESMGFKDVAGISLNRSEVNKLHLELYSNIDTPGGSFPVLLNRPSVSTSSDKESCNILTIKCK